ncbi:hypothetical protein D9O36_14260 [Zobellia amurskyensis]|uniref:Uncharacterized protein n=1 Tax=Zobellia amurskyensis TaxID=248905 RepID=A0A7X3D305_9FLAO|nr:hypothetical protein [Zobellia amurskyensis]MUH37011.1 hypothetical protein [Zobellia amurskyensis]
MKKTSPLTAKSSATFFNFLRPQPKYKFRLVDFKNKDYKTDLLLSQTRCNLEILPKGVMVVGNFDNHDSIIPVLKDEIESISLVRGKETIDTFYLSPMHILLKLGIPSRISRFFKVYPSEYKISETQITIKCVDYQLKLITNGNNFEALLRTFKKSGYSEELDLMRKPTLNLLNYNVY